MKNFYNILNVQENASSEEIKKQYRKLARRYHPDLHFDNKDNASYELRMKEINEAANVLLDKDKRKEYDNFLQAEKERLLKNIEYKEGFQEPIKKDKRLKRLIFLFAIQCIIAIVILVMAIVHFSPFSNDTALSKPEYIDFGLTKAEVIMLLGEPNKETKHLLIYDEYQIVIYLNKVEGWLDPKNKLNVGLQKDVDVNYIQEGMDIISIINKFGNPDSYSKELAIYDNLVLYLKDSKVTNIEVIGEMRT